MCVSTAAVCCMFERAMQGQVDHLSRATCSIISETSLNVWLEADASLQIDDWNCRHKKRHSEMVLVFIYDTEENDVD